MKNKKEITIGLDVKSYTNVKFVEKAPDDVGCPWGWFEEKYEDEHELVTINQHFTMQAGTLVDGGVYKVSPSNVSEYPQWSYGGYNNFRNTLAYAVGYDSAYDCWQRVDKKGFEGLPLSLLICFSDCEGVFDTSVCKTISSELENVNEDVFGGFYKQNFRLLKEVFKDAAENNGIVIWC